MLKGGGEGGGPRAHGRWLVVPWQQGGPWQRRGRRHPPSPRCLTEGELEEGGRRQGRIPLSLLGCASPLRLSARRSVVINEADPPTRALGGMVVRRGWLGLTLGLPAFTASLRHGGGKRRRGFACGQTMEGHEGEAAMRRMVG